MIPIKAGSFGYPEAGLKWPIKIGDVLNSVTRRIKVNGDCADLVEAWPEIIGDQIAKHTRPLAIEDDILVIGVDSSAWLHHLFMLKIEILRTINKRIPGIKIREIRMTTKND